MNCLLGSCAAKCWSLHWAVVHGMRNQLRLDSKAPQEHTLYIIYDHREPTAKPPHNHHYYHYYHYYRYHYRYHYHYHY